MPRNRLAVLALAVAAGSLITSSPAGATQHSESPSPTPTSPTAFPTPCEGPITWSFDISHGVITAGNAPKLYGHSAAPSGSYPSCSYQGRAVRIYERRYGESALREVATVQPDAGGRYELVVRPLVQTDYLAAAGDSPTFSGKVTVRVHRRIDITEGGSTIRGRLMPAEAPIAVGLSYVDASDGYHYLAQTVSDAAGSFSLGGPRPRGTLTYAVYTSARGGLLRGARSIRMAA